MTAVFEPTVAEQQEVLRPTRDDTYIHITVTEATDPEMVAEALRIQGKGYFEAGFVDQDGLVQEGDEAGALIAKIDKSRGPYTDYYLAIHPDLSMSDSVATMRKRHLPPGGTFDDLPTGASARPALTPDGAAYIDGLEAPDVHLKEIGGLAGNPKAVYEIIRDRIQEAQGRGEVWFFSIVSTTFDTMVRRLGQRNLMVIGDQIVLGDDHVKAGLQLVPAVLLPDHFVDNLLADYRDAQVAADVSHQRDLLRSFLFFTDGLDERSMSPVAFAARQELPQVQVPRRN